MSRSDSTREPHFSVAQPLSPRGRELKGIRGLSGMPAHPALVHFPIMGYVFAAVLDVISILVHGTHPDVAREMFHAATWAFIGGGAVGLLSAMTGFADWLNTEAGTQVRRTANTHAVIMGAVTCAVLVDLGLRLFHYKHASFTPLPIMVISVCVGAVVLLGAAYGGALVFEHGFNVEAAATTDAWTHSVIDLTTEQLHESKTLAPEDSSERSERARRIEAAQVHRRTAKSSAARH